VLKVPGVNGAFFLHDQHLTWSSELKSDNKLAALKKDKEIELTVTGRKSGKPLPRPVWFVLRGTELLLLPVTGTDSQWYKNVLRDPRVEIRAGKHSFAGKLHPITEKKHIEEVIELFKSKYGPSDIKKYYPNPNVATSLPID
jgi:deazaflavin-dependent oxidoreductase (nitroreductase family)